MAVYLRTKAVFLDEDDHNEIDIDFALVHISGDSDIAMANVSSIDGFVTLNYHSGFSVNVKSTIAEFDKKLSAEGHKIVQ